MTSYPVKVRKKSQSTELAKRPDVELAGCKHCRVDDRVAFERLLYVRVLLLVIVLEGEKVVHDSLGN